MWKKLEVGERFAAQASVVKMKTVKNVKEL